MTQMAQIACRWQAMNKRMYLYQTKNMIKTCAMMTRMNIPMG